MKLLRATGNLGFKGTNAAPANKLAKTPRYDAELRHAKMPTRRGLLPTASSIRVAHLQAVFAIAA
jgi:hypothetical protein